MTAHEAINDEIDRGIDDQKENMGMGQKVDGNRYVIAIFSGAVSVMLVD